jgi:hypothetical protein
MHITHPGGPKVFVVEDLLDAPGRTKIPNRQGAVPGRVHQLRTDGLRVDKKVQLRLETSGQC